jgi:preprotein translocase SecE subunit
MPKEVGEAFMAIVRTTKQETTTTTGKAPTKNAAPNGRAVPQRTTTRSGNSGQFIAETQAELRRVVWPTKEEVTAGTIVTIMMLFFFAFYVSGLDVIVEKIFEAIGLYGNAPLPK